MQEIVYNYVNVSARTFMWVDGTRIHFRSFILKLIAYHIARFMLSTGYKYEKGRLNYSINIYRVPTVCQR